jgi:hypothetical protein
MPFTTALNDPRANNPGIYTLFKKGQRLYAGRATNLRRRLSTHLWYLQKHDVPVADYTVKLTPMKGADPAKLSRVEGGTIQHWGIRKQGGPLTNVNTREFEMLALSNEAWQ